MRVGRGEARVPLTPHHIPTHFLIVGGIGLSSPFSPSHRWNHNLSRHLKNRSLSHAYTPTLELKKFTERKEWMKGGRGSKLKGMTLTVTMFFKKKKKKSQVINSEVVLY